MQLLNKTFLLIIGLIIFMLVLTITLHNIVRGSLISPLWFAIKEIGYVSIIFSIMIIVILNLHLKIEKAIPWKGNTAKKLIVTFLLYIFIANILNVIWVHSLHYFIEYEDLSKQLFKNVLITNVTTIIMYLIVQSIFIIKEWNASQLLNERLQKENIHAQFETLKSQINPHFLFNCLNTLNSLLYVSVEKSAEFINHFSKIYRYVLDVKEQVVVPVEKELEFARSYFYLHKIQFEEKIKLDIEINPDILNCFIPPLSLQILLENALKHNVVSDNNPLIIVLENREDSLIITNTYQPKINNIKSTGMGLKHLKQRYELISDKIPIFCIKEDKFIATLPIIFEG